MVGVEILASVSLEQTKHKISHRITLSDTLTKEYMNLEVSEGREKGFWLATYLVCSPVQGNAEIHKERD